MRSPIVYYGGKGTMWKKIVKEFPKEGSYDTYIEPFGGGASILFKSDKWAITEIYNDLEENVYSLFKVLSNEHLFCLFYEKCNTTLYSEQLRKDYIKKLCMVDLGIVDRAFYYWYVNRTSINGIGGFKINKVVRRGMPKCLSDFYSSIDGMLELHKRLRKVIIVNRDALSLLKRYGSEEHTFFYLDPPYHHSTKGCTRYIVDYTNDQYAELIDILKCIKAKVLLSGYFFDGYINLLVNGGWKLFEFNVTTQDGKRRSRIKRECLLRNYA